MRPRPRVTEKDRIFLHVTGLCRKPAHLRRPVVPRLSGTGETAANIRLDGTAGSALVETETAGFSIEVQDFGAGISVCSQQFAQDSQVQLNCHTPAVELQVVNPEEARQ